ncbi:homoserine/homoserine lactone efflux protein [Vibrio sp. SCSIO 43136]|uniref:homoserine/homoserine lactone efflux protein n=1 Tax=Vibrio sp. SCSIO 43136 TaxID=2819101 RepID=UPI0020756D02|nr:homoserine/homoserine lactone efflux protein [Vibrio sp. SCSIO 43136]USD65376.1 homoserine/homoserine lactone efflux protein [Vibrio sp. SCSIO 43136]
MDIQVWLAYVLTAIVFSLAPGSGTVNSVSNGISLGLKRSVPAIVGLQVGLMIHILLVGAGIGTLVAQSATAFTIIKWVGVLYLVYLGISKWRDSSSLAIDQGTGEVQGSKLLKKAVLINLTNPKSIVFLVALFPQFIDPAGSQLTQLAILGVTTVIIDSIVMVFYTGLASQLSRFVRSSSQMAKLNKLFGGMFVGCGFLLAGARA